MKKTNITKVAAVLAGTLSWVGTAAASDGYGSVLGASVDASAPNTGLSPISVLPYVALLLVGVALLALSRRRRSHSS